MENLLSVKGTDDSGLDDQPQSGPEQSQSRIDQLDNPVSHLAEQNADWKEDQNLTDSKLAEPESERSKESQEDQLDSSETIQKIPPFANPIPGILEHIFKRIPAEERLVVASVCQSWRRAFLDTSSCWRGIRLGRNANCYSTTPPALHLAGFFPLTHVKEFRFTKAMHSTLCVSREIPHEWLGVVLRQAAKLESLDLSEMVVHNANIERFR